MEYTLQRTNLSACALYGACKLDEEIPAELYWCSGGDPCIIFINSDNNGWRRMDV